MSLFLTQHPLPHYEFVNGNDLLFEANRSDPIVTKLQEYCKAHGIRLSSYTNSNGVFEAVAKDIDKNMLERILV